MNVGPCCGRFLASRSDLSGPSRAEGFRNSLADSVSFRFPSRQGLGGCPAPPAKVAPPAWPFVIMMKDQPDSEGIDSMRAVRDDPGLVLVNRRSCAADRSAPQ